MAMPTRTLLLLFSLLLLSPARSTDAPDIKVVGHENLAVEFKPSPLSEPSPSHDVKNAVSCERVRFAGLSRLRLGSYASSIRATLVPSVVIPDRFHSKILVCNHGNASLGLCQCEKEQWKPVLKGQWSSVMSPFSDGYVDVKVVGDLPGSVTLSVEEEFQRWRLHCLALGFAFLLLAPLVSSWVPFYYSSSMVIGVFLVVLILLFQGMKLLPTGRKSAFYFFMSGSVLGAGSLLCYYFSMLVTSVLNSLGLSEEMHHLVSIFVLIGIVLAGAGLGYWMVRKFVILENGTVDVGIAVWVKGAMRLIAAILFWQSTIDLPLFLMAFLSCWVICYGINRGFCFLAGFSKLRDLGDSDDCGIESSWLGKTRDGTMKPNYVRFRSSFPEIGNQRTAWNSPKNLTPWSNSPVKGVVSQPLDRLVTRRQPDYYSTFHKTPKRKFTQREWANSKRKFTQQGLAELTSSPQFLSWMIDNSERIQVLPDDNGTSESSSDSTGEEDSVHGCDEKRMNLLFNW